MRLAFPVDLGTLSSFGQRAQSAGSLTPLPRLVAEPSPVIFTRCTLLRSRYQTPTQCIDPGGWVCPVRTAPSTERPPTTADLPPAIPRYAGPPETRNDRSTPAATESARSPARARPLRLLCGAS